MANALIGFTGYVGGILKGQHHFDDLYNSKNIEEIKGKTYDYVVCSGAPAEKWKANQQPEADLNNIQKLMDCLGEVHAKHMILISTVDVYQAPSGVNEDTAIDPETTAPYGKHRRYLEQYVESKFPQHSILRLPALFGQGLKKNFIYDLLHDNCLDWTHKDSYFQFYNLNNLWHDISIALEHRLPLLNCATQPVQAKDIAQYCFSIDFTNVTEKPAVSYDMKSKFDSLFGGADGYLRSRETVLDELRAFVQEERGRL